MNYNVAGYIIYLVITIYITFYVGKQCHSNGKVFIHGIFNDIQIGDAVNNILLVAYYLVNIGYAILMVSIWPTITSTSHLLNELSQNIGQIVLLLALLHYLNIVALTAGQHYINKKQIKN